MGNISIPHLTLARSIEVKLVLNGMNYVLSLEVLVTIFDSALILERS